MTDLTFCFKPSLLYHLSFEAQKQETRHGGFLTQENLLTASLLPQP
jgi:hypothetical protein